ncbi:exostosin-like glycosyltransferase, glycosyltransferase family 47 protein [Pseudohyphozyma bogoriensis]|nr:exostosin-like glycosyltransferase, glycosyltransferase family 47 protein [Pseudohyphozyma bogoriensis]
MLVFLFRRTDEGPIEQLPGETKQELAARRALRYDRERERVPAPPGSMFPKLDELVERDRLWPPDLKVQGPADGGQRAPAANRYVYDLPSHLTLPHKKTAQCRWSAYNSELLLHSLLTSPNARQAPSGSLVTTDPKEADLFFIPLFPSCFLFNCWVEAGWKKDLRCGVEEDYILPVMEWVKEQGYWDANRGEDHIIVHPMDFIDGYYTEEARMAMNSSTYLVTVGDLRPPPHSAHYRHYRDIVIPSATHLLNSYYLNPMDYVDELGHPLSTPRGSAEPWRKEHAAPTRVEIWEPSPTWEASVWGKRPDFGVGKVKESLNAGRTTTAIFRGGVGRPGEGEEYALGIRSLFFATPDNATVTHKGFASVPGFDIAEQSENDDYAKALSRSKFGLAPPGYTLDTTRIWEYLAFGVVPVFIGTGPTAGQVMPFEADFDWSSFSISIPRERAHLVPEILAAVTEEEYERLRKNVWETGRMMVLEQSRGYVWKWIARALCRMRMIGTGAGSTIRYT